MLSRSFLLALAVTVSTAAILPQTERITLDVYIESLCPDCFNFITKQLGPQFESISTFVDVRTIPYGNARTVDRPDGGHDFVCQHGPPECEGNLWLSCANQHSKDTAQAVDFTVCLMKYPGYQSKCARDAGIDFEVLNACKQGSEGEGLVFQNALETDALVPRHTGVPWVVFNKQWDPVLQDGAERDLKATCCRLAPKDTPACQ